MFNGQNFYLHIFTNKWQHCRNMMMYCSDSTFTQRWSVLISSPSRPYTDNGDQIHRSVRWIPNHFPSCGTLQDIIAFSNMHVNTFYYNHYLYYTCIVILAIHKITLTVDYTTTVCVPVCGMVDRPPSKVNSFLHRKVVSVAAV